MNSAYPATTMFLAQQGGPRNAAIEVHQSYQVAYQQMMQAYAHLQAVSPSFNQIPPAITTQSNQSAQQYVTPRHTLNTQSMVYPPQYGALQTVTPMKYHARPTQTMKTFKEELLEEEVRLSVTQT